MNWDAIGAVGEIIGAGAIVVSVLYLAVQIRTQNVQAKLAAFHDKSRQFREVTSLFSSPDIADVFVRANENFDSMEDAELLRMIVLTTNL